MIAYLASWTRKKDAVFEAVAKAAGGGRRIAFTGLSFRDFPETAAQVDAAMASAKKMPASRVGRWAKRALIRGQYNWSRRYFAKHPNYVAACWNGITGSRRAFMQGAKDAGAKTLYAELAPFPGRITLDPAGVNALNSVPRDPDAFRLWAEGHSDRQGDGWRGLGANLTARASRRADVGQAGGEGLDGVGSYLFCPLQVPNDSQITLFAGWVESVQGMLAVLAEASKSLPEGWHIRVKEHPSAKASLADALADAVAKANGRIIVDNQTDTFAQVAASGGVITINSSVGLQAFFHDKPVIVLGQAFFAQDGLVHVADSMDRLNETLANAADLGFDPALRAAFMNYLEQVYYPRLDGTPDTGYSIDAGTVARLLGRDG